MWWKFSLSIACSPLTCLQHIFCSTGLQKLRAWTKQSLREKPFATAKGKFWTLTPNFIPLEKIYTKLNLVQKQRGTAEMKRIALSDITQLFSEKFLHQNHSECTRMLVTGKPQNDVLMAYDTEHGNTFLWMLCTFQVQEVLESPHL